jgi:nitrite reductase/ring-hydroxylating ferredoxin subunit
MATIELCKTTDVDEGTAKKVETNGLVLAVFNLNGAFYVMDDLCSHGGFNIKTGEVMEPPCLIPQKVYPVTLKGDTVTIEA